MVNYLHYYIILYYIILYFMTSSKSGQDEPNPMLWLATRAGKMELSCPLRISRLVPQEQRSFFGVLSHIINPLLTKFARSKWLDIGLVLFSRVYGPRRKSRYINTQKKNLANNAYLFATLLQEMTYGMNTNRIERWWESLLKRHHGLACIN